MQWAPLFLIGSALASSMPASTGQKDTSVQTQASSTECGFLKMPPARYQANPTTEIQS